MITYIVMADSKKEAEDIISKDVEIVEYKFCRIYKYSKGKGNNFYQFDAVKKEVIPARP